MLFLKKLKNAFANQMLAEIFEEVEYCQQRKKIDFY